MNTSVYNCVILTLKDMKNKEFLLDTHSDESKVSKEKTRIYLLSPSESKNSLSSYRAQHLSRKFESIQKQEKNSPIPLSFDQLKLFAGCAERIERD